MQARVHYYSPYDLSISMYVDRMEIVLDSYIEGKEYTDLADVIELWHCKKIVENVKFNNWDDEKLAQYQKFSKNITSDIILFFRKFNAQGFIESIKALDYDYQHTVFELLDSVVKDFLTDDILKQVLHNIPELLGEILKNEALTNKHSAYLTDYLKSYPKTAELLLSQFAEKHDSNYKELKFPKGFTLEDKENSILEYCDYKYANLKYINLIALYKNNRGELKLSDKTRLKAIKVAERINKDLFTGDECVKISTQISCSIEDEYIFDSPVFTENKHNEEGIELTTHIYKKFLLACDDPSLIYIFPLYFEWFNDQGYSLLVSNPANMSIFEVIGEHAQYAYPTSQVFESFNHLAALQLITIQKILREQTKSWEKTIKHFYEIHLKETYDYPSPHITIPPENSDYVTKLRTILPEMDAIVKQYDSFVENGEIDLELIAISKPKVVTECRSKLEKRNVYISAEENNPVLEICRLLFSDQSSIAYIKQFEDKPYTTFYDVASKEDVNYNLLCKYQQPYIDFLIEQGILMLDEKGVIHFTNSDFLFIYRLLWKFQVISYWQCNHTIRLEIDKMIEKKWLKTDNCLLSRQEQDWFSYYLNNAKFTNGPAIRNTFAHGANTLFPDNQMKLFYAHVLMLFITLLYKIDLDLRLSIEVDELYKTGIALS